jgi:hypothetical protein
MPRRFMESFVAFARTVFKCIANKQTDRQTFFFIYVAGEIKIQENLKFS